LTLKNIDREVRIKIFVKRAGRKALEIITYENNVCHQEFFAVLKFAND